MGVEIERKFLLPPCDGNAVKELLLKSRNAMLIQQAYFPSLDGEEAMRVRMCKVIKDRDAVTEEYGRMTVKSATGGRWRREYEWDLPLQVANFTEIGRASCRERV